MATTILVIGAALLAASLFIVVFRRTQVPDVLLLIPVGIFPGEDAASGRVRLPFLRSAETG
jgi:hypothetical protein